MSSGPSRRAFVSGAAAVVVSTAAGGAVQQPRLTARQLADRIRERAGVPWREKTIDGFKAGDPETVVSGVATTASATLPVLRRAVEAGLNLIVTPEPVFYTANDDPGNRATDAVYLAKKAFIDQHRLVVWRFSDHWHARRPSDAVTALADALGWTAHRAAGDDDIYQIPSTTLGAIAALAPKRLAVRGGLRTVGPAAMPVLRVVISPGTTDLPGTVARLQRADVILAGEPREWEAVPYVLDMRTAGQQKGMIALGRLVSEEPGVRACAAWIKSLASDLRVEAIPAGDPYWSPAA